MYICFGENFDKSPELIYTALKKIMDDVNDTGAVVGGIDVHMNLYEPGKVEPGCEIDIVNDAKGEFYGKRIGYYISSMKLNHHFQNQYFRTSLLDKNGDPIAHIHLIYTDIDDEQ